MEIFYKITKEQANLIGKFKYASNQMIDPFVGEQKDGYFLISENIFNLLKDTIAFKKVEFDKCEKLSNSELDTKPINLSVKNEVNVTKN